MSIEAEITRLVNEVATQESLISQIQTALEGKAAGGGSGGGTAPTEHTVTVRCVCEMFGLDATKTYSYASGSVVVISTDEWDDVLYQTAFGTANWVQTEFTINGAENVTRLNSRNAPPRIFKDFNISTYDTHAVVFSMPQNDVTVKITASDLM